MYDSRIRLEADKIRSRSPSDDDLVMGFRRHRMLYKNAVVEGGYPAAYIASHYMAMKAFEEIMEERGVVYERD